jgi:hypothetical protein
MPFIQPEPFTFFNIKLTDHGRRSASKGTINFSKAIISDREIDYSISRDGLYDIMNNRILDLPEFYQDIDPYNFDGSETGPIILQNNGFPEFSNTSTFTVGTEKITITGSSSSTTISSFVKGTKTLAYSSNSSNWGTNKITFAGGGYSPVVNDVVAIPWVSPDYPPVSYDPTTMPQNDPCVLTFYKITSAVTAGSVYLVDRPIPDFDTGPSLTCQFFRDNMIESFYGSGKTSDPGVWNMNIVRTYNVMGTQLSVANQVSGYTTYGSIEYNGTKHYFGFKDELPVFGVIHYTNKYTGNTYAEQFVEGTFELNLPGIMWYHNLNAYYNNNTTNSFTSLNADGTTWGLYLSDSTGSTRYDPITKSTYKELLDGRDGKSFSVGRVYHKLQLVVITDQELLTALTYKSNRNYTLPDFDVSLSQTPQNGLYPAYAYSASTVSGYTATGLIDDGYDYFITYIAENEPYSSGLSIGNAPSLPCGYIKKITGVKDFDGNKQFLKLKFPNPNSFPYMRDDAELSAVNYGTGWNANTVQLLVNRQPTSRNYQVGNVPYTDWVRVSNKTLGGNGVYRASDYGLNTIDARNFNLYEFIISEEDFNSGSTYTINSGLTANQSFLNFGDECFVYGTIKTGIAATVYKTIFQVFVDDSELNGSSNFTFNPELNTNTYITEVAILDNENNVVAAGKPTYPIRKNNIRWLTLQLDIDF